MRLMVLGAVVVVAAALALAPSATAEAAPADAACWGQATKAFVEVADMGEHASQQAVPRLGLRNLARALAAEGVIPDDSMQALGTFVVDALGLDVDACD